MSQPAGQEEWESLSGGKLVTWNEPKTLEGEYQGFVTTNGKFGEQKKYTLITKDPAGEPSLVEFYAPAILDRQLQDPRLVKGARIRIVFEGKTVKTKGGQQAKDFQVQIARVA